jgi:hypothetical protein
MTKADKLIKLVEREETVFEIGDKVKLVGDDTMEFSDDVKGKIGTVVKKPYIDRTHKEDPLRFPLGIEVEGINHVIPANPDELEKI